METTGYSSLEPTWISSVSVRSTSPEAVVTRTPSARLFHVAISALDFRVIPSSARLSSTRAADVQDDRAFS
jgi:hypothetical protein